MKENTAGLRSSSSSSSIGITAAVRTSQQAVWSATDRQSSRVQYMGVVGILHPLYMLTHLDLVAEPL